MAKWTLPENRKPITTMESADLVKKMHDKLAAGFTAGDRIARLEELYEAALEDAKEAEAYAEELEAKLAKAVEALEFLDENYRLIWGVTARAKMRTTLAELKGETDE
jgi:hypothetical protein